MRWVDRHADDERWLGLALSVGGAARSSLRVEAVPRRIRLNVAGTPRLWARIDDDHSGLRWCIAADTAPPLPPIDWPTLRAVGDTTDRRAWARFFARWLHTHDFLESGRWLLAEPWAPASPPGAAVRVAPAQGLPPMYGLSHAAALGRRGQLGWGINGSAEVLPLRLPSPSDAGRLKAWRKRAAADGLPPALLLWITGLDCYVVLDGHDRLRVAAELGLTLPALALIGEQHRSWPRGEWQAEALRRYRLAEANGAGERALLNLQANLVAAHDDRLKCYARTRAWRLSGGLEAWVASLPEHARGWLA
jgi:hypothetical protein